MLRRSFLLTMCLVLAALAGAQAQARSVLAWSEKRLLVWEDFSGQPDPHDPIHAATTYAGLELEVEDVRFGGQMTFAVWAVFDRGSSWAHPDRIDEYVLAHEQLHFDIAEAWARRLERKLNSLQIKTRNKAYAKKLHYQYTKLQLREQERYDTESRHGLNREKQQEWRQRLDRELRIKRTVPELAKQ